MKNKVIVSIVFLLVVLGWSGRFYYLNKTCEKPSIVEYGLEEIVEYGNDFFFSSNNNSNGYKIIVHSSEVIRYEEFAEKYNLSLPPIPEEGSYKAKNFYRPKYVYDVQVTIINENNTEGGIDMSNTLLINSNYLRFSVDETLWALLYPQLQGSYTFKARENSQMDFHFPFVPEFLNDKECTKEFLEKEKFTLVISQYPTKKIIKVK